MLAAHQIGACIAVILIGGVLIYRTIKKFGELQTYMKDDPVFGASSFKFCGQEFNYADIEGIQVKKDTSNVSLETRFYAGGACSRLNYDKIIINFKNGKTLQIPTIRRKTLNKYLKELAKHTSTGINPDDYKEPFATGYEILILTIVIIWIITGFLK